MEDLTSKQRAQLRGCLLYTSRTHPDLPEGDLTRTRAALVCEGSLVEVARALNLGAYLKLGKGDVYKRQVPPLRLYDLGRAGEGQLPGVRPHPV